MSDTFSPFVGASDIDVWLTDYTAVTDPTVLARFELLMNSTERAQQQRFRFADDRLRYLVTRALLRTVLSTYAPVAPADWEFTLNEYGRPGISARHGLSNLSFNISHTKGLIALAVSRRFEVGIDVENTALRPAPLEVAGQTFAPTEVADLDSMAPDLQHERFFTYWTLKESYVKARGMGLSLPLDRFSFSFPLPRRIHLGIAPELEDDAAHWRFWLGRPTPDHLLALCVGQVETSTETSPPCVAVHSMVPGAGDHTLSLDWLRSPA